MIIYGTRLNKLINGQNVIGDRSLGLIQVPDDKSDGKNCDIIRNRLKTLVRIALSKRIHGT